MQSGKVMSKCMHNALECIERGYVDSQMGSAAVKSC